MSFYDVLGVPRDATQAEIKKAYRKAAMQHHEDRGGSTEKMAEVNEAYECLSNKESRDHYDRVGSAPKSEPSLDDLARQGLVKAFMDIAEAKDWQPYRYVRELRKVLGQNGRDILMGIKRRQKLADRIHLAAPKSGGQEDIFNSAILQKKQMLLSQIEDLEREQKLLVAGLSILDDCEDVELDPTQPAVFQSFTSADFKWESI